MIIHDSIWLWCNRTFHHDAIFQLSWFCTAKLGCHHLSLGRGTAAWDCYHCYRQLQEAQIEVLDGHDETDCTYSLEASWRGWSFGFVQNSSQTTGCWELGVHYFWTHFGTSKDQGRGAQWVFCQGLELSIARFPCSSVWIDEIATSLEMLPEQLACRLKSPAITGQIHAPLIQSRLPHPHFSLVQSQFCSSQTVNFSHDFISISSILTLMFSSIYINFPHFCWSNPFLIMIFRSIIHHS